MPVPPLPPTVRKRKYFPPKNDKSIPDLIPPSLPSCIVSLYQSIFHFFVFLQFFFRRLHIFGKIGPTPFGGRGISADASWQKKSEKGEEKKKANVTEKRQKLREGSAKNVKYLPTGSNMRQDGYRYVASKYWHLTQDGKINIIFAEGVVVSVFRQKYGTLLSSKEDYILRKVEEGIE
jgi:hypothetical protein